MGTPESVSVLLVGSAESTAGAGSVLSGADEFTTTTVDDVADALDQLDGADCVVAATDLPDGSGLDLVERVHERRPSVPIVLVVEEWAGETVAAALGAGVTAVLPSTPRRGQFETLPDRLRSAVDADRLRPGASGVDESYRQLVETAPVPIWIQRMDEILYCNETAADFFGVEDTDELVGASAMGRVVPSERERTRERNRRMLEEGWTSEAMGGQTVGFDGVVRDALYAGTPISYDGDAAILVVARDVTDLRQREAELERQNERLEEFANVVSHDLRNPLQVASGYLENAMESCDDAALEEVAAAHQRMHDIVEDVLTLARKGRTVDETTDVSLSTVAERAWSAIDHDDADLVCAGSLTFRADEGRLRSLLENLFANAVTHGDATSVRVGPLEETTVQPPQEETAESMASTAVGAGERPTRLAAGFFVEDDGSGVPPEDRGSVFDSGFSTDSEGTGFGLAIVRRIAEAHGWSVSLSEGPDGGARFEVRGVTVTGA